MQILTSFAVNSSFNTRRYHMHITKVVMVIYMVMLGVVSSTWAQITTYQYSSTNQLVKMQQADCTHITYTYDANGNRTERIVQPCPEISGAVVDADGNGIEGVALQGLPGNPTTGITGFYNVQVEPGWSGAVTPQKADYSFEPLERTYTNLAADQSEQNYIGVLPRYTLTIEIVGKGTVSGDGGLECPDLCSQEFDKHTLVAFSALPAEGFVFESCTQAECDASGYGSLTITADTTVTVTFVPDPTITPTPTQPPGPTPTPTAPKPVPEPGTMLLLGIGLLALLAGFAVRKITRR